MDSEERKPTENKVTDNPQLAMLELKGQVNYFDDYDYKALRRKRDEKLKRLSEKHCD